MRTDPSVPKHKGITCLLVDMTLPGVEVRPLVTITGEKEFNEIFFTDVRVPVDCTLGPVNEGWRVAMTTLAYERGTVAKLHTGTRGKIAPPHRRGPDARRWATAAWPPTIRCSASKLAASTSTASCSSSSPTARCRPSCTAARWAPKAASPSCCGARPSSTSPSSRPTCSAPTRSSGPWARDRVYSRALTIAGGTTQVNKNILAQRILGLPATDACRTVQRGAQRRAMRTVEPLPCVAARVSPGAIGKWHATN